MVGCAPLRPRLCRVRLTGRSLPTRPSLARLPRPPPPPADEARAKEQQERRQQEEDAEEEEGGGGESEEDADVRR